MNSSFPDRWSFSYLSLTKICHSHNRWTKAKIRTTRTSNSKEPQQKYRLGTVSIKTLRGLNRFNHSKAVFLLCSSAVFVCCVHFYVCPWYFCCLFEVSLVSHLTGKELFAWLSTRVVFGDLSCSLHFFPLWLWLWIWNTIVSVSKWAASSEFGAYHICEQRRFRRACASAQSRQNLRCSLIQALSQEEPSDRKPDP